MSPTMFLMLEKDFPELCIHAYHVVQKNNFTQTILQELVVKPGSHLKRI